MVTERAKRASQKGLGKGLRTLSPRKYCIGREFRDALHDLPRPPSPPCFASSRPHPPPPSPRAPACALVCYVTSNVSLTFSTGRSLASLVDKAALPVLVRSGFSLADFSFGLVLTREIHTGVDGTRLPSPFMGHARPRRARIRSMAAARFSLSCEGTS